MQLDLSLVGKSRPAEMFTYDWRACASYALGVGAGADDLHLLWEKHPAFAVLPTFAVTATTDLVFGGLRAVGADFRRLVHGSQRIRLHRPLPTAGTLHTDGGIVAIHDKGKGAVVLVDTVTEDADGPIFETRWSIFCRGQGGFGGERGTTPTLPAPVGPPLFEATLQTRPEQALLYRLSGDTNPLHVDPALAEKAGFERPILHGLCTYGFAVRSLVDGLCGGDPTRVGLIDARFSGIVLPGDALRVAACATDDAGIFRFEAHVGERQVLSHGLLEVSP